MLTDLLSMAVKVAAVFIFVALIVYSLMPGTKFIKKYGRFDRESDRPF